MREGSLSLQLFLKLFSSEMIYQFLSAKWSMETASRLRHFQDTTLMEPVVFSSWSSGGLRTLACVVNCRVAYASSAGTARVTSEQQLQHRLGTYQKHKFSETLVVVHFFLFMFNRLWVISKVDEVKESPNWNIPNIPNTDGNSELRSLCC